MKAAVLLCMLMLCGCIVMEKEYRESGETVLPPQEAPQGEAPAPEEEPPAGDENESAASGGPVPPAGSPEREEGDANVLMGQQELTVEEAEVGEGKTEKEYGGMEFDGYTLLLEDLTDDYPYPCAALRIVKISGTEIMEYKRTEICPGHSGYWESPEGKGYRIKVFETAAGYSEGVHWADIAIYGQ